MFPGGRFTIRGLALVVAGVVVLPVVVVAAAVAVLAVVEAVAAAAERLAELVLWGLLQLDWCTRSWRVSGAPPMLL